MSRRANAEKIALKYRIERHIQYRLKRPYNITSDENRTNIKKSAYERKDDEGSLRVNVLIMAKEKKNRNGHITAGELLGKLSIKKNRNAAASNPTSKSEEYPTGEAYLSDEQTEKEPQYDYIDVSSESEEAYDSESSLDINELLKKYMPELVGETNEDEDASDVEEIHEEELSELSALDAAFTDMPEEGYEETWDAEEADGSGDTFGYEEEILGGADEEDGNVDPDSEADPQTSFEEALDGLYSDDVDGNYVDDAEAVEEYVEGDEEAISDGEVLGEENVEDDSGEESSEDEGSGEFDPTDINLMVAFGLDNENGGDTQKTQKAKALGDRLEAAHNEHAPKLLTLDRPEFVDKSQVPKIREEFKKRHSGLLVRMGICTLLAIILMVYENIPTITGLFGDPKQLGGVFDPTVYPTVFVMISLQIMLLACLCAFDQLVDGVKHLICGVPTPESMSVVMVVAGIIYSAVICRVVTPGEAPVTFNFIVALNMLLTLVYAWFNNRREMMNFRIVANKRPKHIVRRLLDEESECEAKAFAEQEDVCDVMKIEKTDFIDGFFARLSKLSQSTNVFMMFLMGITAVVAILFGLVAKIRGGDASDVTSAIYAALLLIAPLSIYVTFSYPFYRANVIAREYDSAIVGETSLEEYSNASVISFDDKNVFPSYSVKVQNIRIYNNARIDRVLYYAASAFAYAGGPLQDVFEVATKDMGNSQNVKIFDTEPGFLATQVDGVNIIFGSCDALRTRGLEIPDSAALDDVDLSDELSIMYMFRESKLVAKMYIQYVMDSDIDSILKQFAGNGLYVCVRTFDPNIDEYMIARKLNTKRMPLKIVRYSSADEVGRYEAKADSGLVTCGTPKSLLQIISYCGKVLNMKKTNVALSVLSVMISVSVMLLMMLSDSLTSMSSLFIALYQLVWLIPMTIASKLYIR